jgi:hypothetical protein
MQSAFFDCVFVYKKIPVPCWKTIPGYAEGAGTPYRQFVNPLCEADLRYQYITSASLRKGGYFYD